MTQNAPTNKKHRAAKHQPITGDTRCPDYHGYDKVSNEI